MFCRKCGKQILDDSKFCQYCGVEVKEIEVTPIDAIITITEQEAKSGVEKEFKLNGMEKTQKVLLPKNIANGQLIHLCKVKVINSDGKKTKKDAYIKIEVKN